MTQATFSATELTFSVAQPTVFVMQPTGWIQQPIVCVTETVCFEALKTLILMKNSVCDAKNPVSTLRKEFSCLGQIMEGISKTTVAALYARRSLPPHCGVIGAHRAPLQKPSRFAHLSISRPSTTQALNPKG